MLLLVLAVRGASLAVPSDGAALPGDKRSQTWLSHTLFMHSE